MLSFDIKARMEWWLYFTSYYKGPDIHVVSDQCAWQLFNRTKKYSLLVPDYHHINNESIMFGHYLNRTEQIYSIYEMKSTHGEQYHH